LGKSVTQGAFYSPQLADQVRLWSSEFQFDAAIMYCSSMGPYAKLMKTKPKRLIVDLVDVDSQKWDDYADVAYGPKKLLFRQEARRVGLLEESLSESADAMTVVSPDEAQLFAKRHPGLQATSIGNGVDLRFFAPDALPFEKFSDLVPPSVNPRLVFVGVLDYLPNVQGLQWFCDEVLPRLQSVFPSVSLDIVGRRPSGEVQALAKRSGVNLVGEVPDVRPYVLAAQIAIAPLQIARGVQNKVLEALACGKPVVASPQAATGIECSGGMSVVSQPAEWVQAIVELQIPDHYAKMSSCARSEVLEKYSWNAQLEPLLSLIGIA
jgi:sugar transferase (PEP-CTERM/EpsH1 system associated)